MNRQTRYSPEFRERAVRLLFEHQAEYDSQWAAMNSIAGKVRCTAETLRKWVRCAERDQGLREGLTTSDRERLKALELENRELTRANIRLPPDSGTSRLITRVINLNGQRNPLTRYSDLFLLGPG